MPKDEELLEDEEPEEEPEEDEEEDEEEETEEGSEEDGEDDDAEGSEEGSEEGDDESQRAGKGDKPVSSAKMSKIVAREVRKAVQKERQAHEDPHVTLAEEAGVPPLRDRQELTEAVRLWKYLEHNPDIAAAVQEVLRARPGKMPTYEGRSNKSSEGSGSVLELRMARMDLRGRDKLFRKYEGSVLDWAESKDIPIKDERSLNLAYQAWKGAHMHLLTAKAEAQGAKKARDGQSKARAAGTVPRKGGAKTGKPDYRKMRDTDVLRSLGIKLEVED